MSEQNEVMLVKWVVITDNGQYEITERELDILMGADKVGARFVRFDKVVLNTAFIKEIQRKAEKRDLRFNTISGEEKYVVEDKRDNPKIE